jgi:hypothetical protein
VRPIISLVILSLVVLGSAAVSTPRASAQELVGEGQRGGTKIVIRGLTRDDGGTVTLRFRLVNDGDTPQPIYQLIGNSLDGHAHLIDAANKKKYLVVKDTSGNCECSRFEGDVTKGSPVNLWVKFPAPPASVQKITVVVDGFEPIESVPLTAR